MRSKTISNRPCSQHEARLTDPQSYAKEDEEAPKAFGQVIEGYGVDPDIEVENDPKSVIQGKDPQLERAVTEVMNKLKVKPGGLPNRPPAPVKMK